jgi:hypothetical protein
MKQFSKEEKAMWLEGWQQSGKKAWTYARENGLAPQTFVSWIKPRSKKKQSLVEVPKEIFPSGYPAQEVLIEKGEVKIHIPLEPVLGELYAIVKRIGQTI